MRRYLRQVTEKLTFWRQAPVPQVPRPTAPRDGDGLRELACLVVEENVDLSHLPSFIDSLMAERLMELSGAARRVARELSRQFSDLSPDDVAYLLRRRAKALDSEASPRASAQ